MDKKKILKKLNQEKEYYKVEYLEKHKKNKTEFKNIIFHDVIDELKDSEFILNQQDNKLVFIGINESITIEQKTNIEQTSKNPLLFNILVIKDSEEKNYQFRPFNDSPLPNPDINRLQSDPDKGKDLLDIEIEAEKKNIDYFKSFIAENLDFEQYIFVLQTSAIGYSGDTDPSSGDVDPP